MTCWRCEGRGWVLDGTIEDGMISGRARCWTCRGTREVSEGQVLAEIQRILNLSTSPKGTE